MSRHLIICTNNPTLADAVSQASEGGPRITVSESGLQVLATVDLIHVDLLVLDLETPGIDSLLLTSAIRALAPALPILAVSSHPSGAGRDLSRKGVSFVALPVDRRAWARALGTALDALDCSDAMARVSLPTGPGAH